MLRQIQPSDKLYYAKPLPGHLVVETAAGERFLAPLAPLDDSPREQTPYRGNYDLTPVPEHLARFYRPADLPPAA